MRRIIVAVVILWIVASGFKATTTEKKTVDQKTEFTSDQQKLVDEICAPVEGLRVKTTFDGDVWCYEQ